MKKTDVKGMFMTQGWKSVFTMIIVTGCLAGCVFLKKPSLQTPVDDSTIVSPSPVEIDTTSSPSAMPTALPTVITTPTNMFIISPGEEVEVLSRFVKENGGCLLPCVMGLSPGISDQLAVESYFRYFTENSHFSDDQYDNVNVVTSGGGSFGGVGLHFWQDLVGVNIIIDYYGYDGVNIDFIVLEATSEGYCPGLE